MGDKVWIIENIYNLVYSMITTMHDDDDDDKIDNDNNATDFCTTIEE